jgi:hypothetical protein
MTKEQQQSVGFALVKINLEQFAIIEDLYQKDKAVEFTTALNFAVSNDNKRIKVFVRFGFEQEKKPFIIIEGSCEFSVVPSSWDSFANAENNSIVFPKGFIAHIAALTVGSVRGMLHVKTENTKFNKYFIPTINVAEMVSEDVKFDI